MRTALIRLLVPGQAGEEAGGADSTFTTSNGLSELEVHSSADTAEGRAHGASRGSPNCTQTGGDRITAEPSRNQCPRGKPKLLVGNYWRLRGKESEEEESGGATVGDPTLR